MEFKYDIDKVVTGIRQLQVYNLQGDLIAWG
jgi:hypothetical protein